MFGYGISAAKMRAKANLPTLADRRFAACERFVASLASSPRFCHWLEKKPGPAYPQRADVNYGLYKEFPAKTLRCYNSPLYYYRRILNGRTSS